MWEFIPPSMLKARFDTPEGVAEAFVWVADAPHKWEVWVTRPLPYRFGGPDEAVFQTSGASATVAEALTQATAYAVAWEDLVEKDRFFTIL